MPLSSEATSPKQSTMAAYLKYAWMTWFAVSRCPTIALGNYVPHLNAV
jgi:hypothetical protein